MSQLSVFRRAHAACCIAIGLLSLPAAASGAVAPARHAHHRADHASLGRPRGLASVRGGRLAVTGRGHTVHAQSAVIAPGAAPATGLFAADSIWNQPVASTAATDPSSSTLVSALSAEAASEYASGIGPWIATTGSGTIYTVPAAQPTVQVQLDSPSAWWRVSLQSAFAAVPIPAGATPSGGSDAEMTVLQPSTDRLWEFFHARLLADGWHAAWGGAIQNVSQSPGYYTLTSWSGSLPQWGATASSLPVAGGEITLADIRAGYIGHALALDVPYARAGVFAYPAQRTDGDGGLTTLPEGAHLRLDPNLDLTTLNLSPFALMLARAAQRYGIVVRDQTHHGLSFFVQDPSSIGNAPFYTAGRPSPVGPVLGKWPTQVLRTFPWSRLQVLQMALHSTGTGATTS